MKKIIIISVTFIFTFVCCFSVNTLLKETTSVNSIARNSRNLVIDPGHGGIDAGTIGTDNNNEKDINLSIALKLYDFAMVSGISSFLVRDGDYLVYSENDDKTRSDLYNRMDYINTIDNATLISIHQNHFDNEKEWGMQIWYAPNSENSKKLADSILKISKENTQPENTRQNKESDSNYYLLHKAKVPSVMVECGFMSNAEENKKLQDDNYQKRLAYSIMLGFSDYLTNEE